MPLTMDLHAQVLSVDEVTPQRRGEMFQLMDQYYAGMLRTSFDTDLAQKHWIIQLVQRDSGILCGFSTQVLWELRDAERTSGVLFSGDTIIDHRYWGNNPLAQAWGRFALSLIDRHERDGRQLVWYLIVKGYKTYRFLPLFFHEFYPRFDAVTPPWAQHLIDRLGTDHFPTRYNRTTGVIQAERGGCRLHDGVADITPGRLRDPHIRFFATRNPDHANGDELCCIAPLTRENFKRAARRVIGRQAFPDAVKT